MKKKQTSVVSRDMFAKILATEDLDVVHKSGLKTAMFDIKNRKLLLPVWKDTSEELYTLLISHEVSHALNTHLCNRLDTLCKDKLLKTAFNIVEDARIDKLIQRKFPGVKKSYAIGLKELKDRGFFGDLDNPQLDEQGNPKKMNFADRVCLYFKLQKYGHHTIEINNAEEQSLIDRIDACETIDEAMDLSEELLKYVEKEMEDQDLITDGDPQNGEGEGEEEEVEVDPDNFEISDGPPPPNSRKVKIKNLSDVMDKFEKAMADGILDKNGSEPIYCNIPKYDLSKIVVGYKDVLENFKRYYAGKDHDSDNKKKAISEGKLKYTSFSQYKRPEVNHMVQQFEMKKRAAEQNRAKISTTGVINPIRLHSYKHSDDVFKKNTVFPKGKNHGLMMFIDFSSSMTDNMAGSIEQLITLVTFCRKLQLPYEVYGFNDNVSVDNAAPYKEGDIMIESLQLRQYFSHKMNNFEFQYMCNYMMTLAINFSSRRSSYIPNTESLNSTPLNQTVVASMQMVKEFKKNNNLDIVNIVYLTDGGGTDGLTPYGRNNYSRYANKMVIKDRDTNKIFSFNNDNGDITDSLIEITKNLAEVNIVNFYITSGTNDCKIVEEGAWDSLFHIPNGKKLKADAGQFVFEKGDDLAKIFADRAKKNIILNKFIDLIA